MHGWVIYNGYLPGTKFLDFAQWIQAAAAKRNIHIDIYRNNELFPSVTTGELSIINHKKEKLPDFCVFADKDIYLAKQMELLGIPLFNSAASIALSDDKIAAYQTFAAKKLPVPKTVIAPKAYYQNENSTFEEFDDAIDQLGLPLIMKEAFGSFGEQVYLVQTAEEARSKIQALHGKPFMLQEYIASSHGRDARLHVVGNDVVAAMCRHASNDFRANVTAGGKMKQYQPTTAEKEIAVAAAKAIGAEIAGVDLLFGADNQPVICEINSNAHIRNMYDCTGINVADFIIGHIIKTLDIR